MENGVAGWMGPEELDTLARWAREHKKILEIGSWYGRSTRVLAEASPGVVYAVDWWQGCPGHKPSVERAKVFNGDFAFMEFMKNNGDLIDKGKIIPIRMRSDHANWVLHTLGIKFDMVFIDGDHAYEAAKADIIGTSSLLAKNGLMCGHDYYTWRGVKQAVDELLPVRKFAGTANVNSIWYV